MNRCFISLSRPRGAMIYTKKNRRKGRATEERESKATGKSQKLLADGTAPHSAGCLRTELQRAFLAPIHFIKSCGVSLIMNVLIAEYLGLWTVSKEKIILQAAWQRGSDTALSRPEFKSSVR
jgi:hypothetical protein